MKKKEYISPSVYWIWVGMKENAADVDVYGDHVSTQARSNRTNVWSTQESSDENEVWGQSW